MIRTAFLIMALVVPSLCHAGWRWQPTGVGFLRVDESGVNDGWFYLRGGCCGNYRYSKQYRIARSYGSSDWKSKLADVAARIKDNEAFVAALAELGLTPAQAQAYGVTGGYGYQATAEQGQTLYGYHSYGERYTTTVDLGSLYNQAARLANNAQDLARRAHEDFSGLVSQEGANQALAAAIEAQGRAAAAALAATKPPPVTTHESWHYESGTTDQPADDSGNVPVAVALAQPTLQSVLTNRCVSCHGADKPAHGLDLSSVATWTAEQRSEWAPKIVAAITAADPAKRMPRGADGGPGEALTPAETCTIVLGLQ